MSSVRSAASGRRKRGRVVVRSAGAALLLASLTGLTAAAAPAQAFAPTPWLSLGAESHESITEDVVTSLTADYFGRRTQTARMRSALREITDADAAVDDDQVHSALHFDGENFGGGQARILRLKAETIRAARAGDVSTAREALGGALHTVQDFYAHSNWVELGNTSINTDLGVEGRTIAGVAGPTEPTCRKSRLITKSLTSGYYGGEDRVAQVATKCRHGGPFDNSPGEGGINKDLLIEALSPHHQWHEAAASLARQATRAFLDQIRDRLTDDQVRQLFGAPAADQAPAPTGWDCFLSRFTGRAC